MHARWLVVWLVVAGVGSGRGWRSPGRRRTVAAPRRRGRFVYHARDLVALRAKVRYTTMIALPDGEDIIEVTCGDKEFWIVNAHGGVAYVKPAKPGSDTNLNLLTASGHVYAFVLSEISEVKGAEPDLAVYLESDDPALVARAHEPPKYVPAQQLEDFRAQAEIAREDARRATAAARGAPRGGDHGVSHHLSAPPAVHVSPRARDGAVLRARDVSRRPRDVHPGPSPELPSLYELKDGLPNLINFEVHDGTYVVPKVLDSGYFTIGKKRLEFHARRRAVGGAVMAEPSHVVTGPGRARRRSPIIDGRRPGVMPRQLQRWVLVGPSRWSWSASWRCRDGPRSRDPVRRAPATAAAAVDANQQRIEEYQRRIEEQAQRLAAEQAALQATKGGRRRPETPAAGPADRQRARRGTEPTTTGGRPAGARAPRGSLAVRGQRRVQSGSRGRGAVERRAAAHERVSGAPTAPAGRAAASTAACGTAPPRRRRRDADATTPAAARPRRHAADARARGVAGHAARLTERADVPAVGRHDHRDRADESAGRHVRRPGELPGHDGRVCGRSASMC